MIGPNATLALLLLMSSTPTTPSGQPGPMKQGEFTAAAESKVVSWQLKRVPPPSPVYITVDDQLGVAGASALANEVVTISYRLLRAVDGKIVFGQFTLPMGAAFTVNRNTQGLAEGFLLSTTISAFLAQFRGLTYVRLFVNPVSLGAGVPGFTLTADYVTQDGNPGHPYGRILAPEEGPGAIVTQTIANPNPGADWAITLPDHTRSRIQVVRGALLTSGTAGTRIPRFTVNDSAGNILGAWTATASQIASLSWAYTWSSAPIITPALQFQIPVPLPAGLIVGNLARLASVTSGILAGDQWSTIDVLLEQWLSNV